MISRLKSKSSSSLNRRDHQRILDSIRQIVRELRVSSRDAERSVGISGAQLFVLRTLNDSSAASLNELARRTLTHQSSVSVVVRRLVEKGLVLRTVSRIDARRVALGLSAKGRVFLERAPETAQERLVRAIEGLSPRQRITLGDLLHAVMKSAGISREIPELFFEGQNEPLLSGDRSSESARRRK